MLPLVALLLLQSSEPPKAAAPVCSSPMVAEKRFQPDYPKNSQKAGVEGTVELEARVDPEGNVRDVQVISGDSELAKAAVDAFRKWKYAPCMADGKPTESSVATSFAFKLKRPEHYATSCPSSRNSPGNATAALPAGDAKRVRVMGGVTAGALDYGPKPEYPAAARVQHLGGSVVMCAIIGKDGTLRELGVISGHPILAEAAYAAVKQWRYKPYKLNGEPVEVDTTITVNFQHE